VKLVKDGTHGDEVFYSDVSLVILFMFAYRGSRIITFVVVP